MSKNDGIIVNRQTVWRVLKEAGGKKRVKKEMKVYHEFEIQHPRHLIGGRFEKYRTALKALSLLWSSVIEKGLPFQICSDRGKQFKSHLSKGLTHFENVCKRLRIEPIFASREHPQGKGKIERLFGFI